MTTEPHVSHIVPAVAPQPRKLEGFDLLLNEWSDYAFRYGHHIDNDRLVEALRGAVNCHPHFAGRKVSSDDAVQLDDFSGVLFGFEQVDHRCPEDIDLLDRRSNGYFHPTDFRRRHKLAHTSRQTPLLQIKHTAGVDGSVLGVSVWHSIADFSRVVRFFETVTRIYQGLQPRQTEPSNPLRATEPAPGLEPDAADHSDAVVRITAESTQPFSEAFALRRFRIDEQTLQALRGRASSAGTKWTDYLYAAAWRTLAASNPERLGSDSTLFLIQSIEQVSGPARNTFNSLIYPTARVPGEGLQHREVEDLAKVIGRTATFGALKEIRAVSAVRAWMSRNIHRSNYHNFMLKPFHESVFGAGVMCNNFSETPLNAFDFGQGPPLKIDMLAEAGLRLMMLEPFEASNQGYTFTVALFESELARFGGPFTDWLSSLRAVSLT
jgi:hypothetical protein